MDEKQSGEGKGKKLEKESIFCRGEEKWKRKGGDGKYLVGSGEENGEGKGGKYLEKENFFFSRWEGKEGK